MTQPPQQPAPAPPPDQNSHQAEQEAAALIAELTGTAPPPKPEDQADAEAEEPQSLGSKIFGPIWSMFKFLMNWLITPALIVLVLHFFVFQAYHVVGSSMFPTLHETDYLIISKIGPSVAEAKQLVGQEDPYIPERGDVVIFRFPHNPRLTFVKRVIAVPGERVVVKEGIITVYNEQFPDGFNPDERLGYDTSDPITLGDVDGVVPEGHIFVVGDNRSPGGSFDSREWGFLPSDDIIGIAILRLLPVNNIKAF